MQNNYEIVKTRRFKIGKYTCTVDFPVLFLFFGVFLDIISTSLFVVLKVGTEANFILKELIPISIWFIPIYLLSSNAVFVPFLSKVLRKTLGYTFGFVNGLLGLNNFSLVIFKNAFLVDTIGFYNLIILFVVLGFTIFVYFVNKEKLDKKETIYTCLKLVLYLIFLGLIQFLYVVIPTFARAPLGS